MSDPDERLTEVLFWMVKFLMVIYLIAIVGDLIANAVLGVHTDAAIIASLTTLLTTALGGVIAAVVRRVGLGGDDNE